LKKKRLGKRMGGDMSEKRKTDFIKINAAAH
jgi:hypothetical protein